MDFDPDRMSEYASGMLPKSPDGPPNIDNVYRKMMNAFGAKKDGWAETGFDPGHSQNQRLWRVDRRPKKTKIGSADFDDWFEPAADGNGYTLKTNPDNPYAVDPSRGGGEKSRATKRLSNAELWKRGNTYKIDHFLGQRSPGFSGLSGSEGNIGYGKKIPDQIMGGANTFPNMLDAQDAVNNGTLAGTIDSLGEDDYRLWREDMEEILGEDGIKDQKLLKQLDSFKPVFAPHPLPRLPDDVMGGLVSSGSQPSDKLLSDLNFALNKEGSSLPGNERSVATLIGELERDGMKPDVYKPKDKPFELKPGQSTREAYELGGLIGKKKPADKVMKASERIPYFKNTRQLKNLAKGIGGGMLYAAPVMAIDYFDPEANQRGRNLAEESLGKYANTQNWFGGSESHPKFTKEWRRNNLENVGRFIGDMGLETLYSVGGLLDPTKKRVKPNRRFRFGSQRTGLIPST